MKVMARPCETCIYRKDCWLDLEKLERQVSDPYMEGFFKTYRQCHHSSPKAKVCCRGFWNRHKDKFTLGQIAQRLGIVRFVKGMSNR